MATDLETATVVPAEESDSLPAADPSDSVVLHGVSWKMYRKLRKMRENCHVRMTYDRGELAIVRQLAKAHETDLLRSFRDWVRANLQPGG